MAHSAGDAGVIVWADGVDSTLAAFPAANLTGTVVDARLPTTAQAATLAATYMAAFLPEKYGALGNGSTDDSAALTACLTAARAVNGGVRFTAGKTYIVAGVFNPTGCTLDGYGAIVKLKPGTTPSGGGLFQGTGFTILGLTIDLNKANTTDPASNTTGMAVYAYGAAGWTTPIVIRDVTVKNGYQVGITFGTGSAATDPVNMPSSPALVENTIVSACKWGIMTGRNSDITIKNCTISGMSQEGIYDARSQRTTVTGNTISGCASHGVVTSYGRETRIVGNSSSGNTGSGLCVGGGSTTYTPSTHWTISGNTCLGNGGGTWAGITVDTSITGALTTPVPSYGTITGNTCNGNASGIVTTMAQYVAINGNDCTSNTNYGITTNSANNTISGNSCSGNAIGIALFGVNGNHTIGANGVEGNSSLRYVIDVTVLNSPITYYDTHSPWGGAWGVGSRVINSTPAAGQPKAWVCTVAGSVGTWVSEGNL